MIVDTSAIIAIPRAEPERAAFIDAILAAPTVKISAGTYLKACIVMDAVGDPVGVRQLDQLKLEFGAEIAHFSQGEADTARRAYRDFGKGNGHPADLDFGDTFAYSLAVTTAEQLLFKGDDFTHTDVEVAAG